MKKAGGKKAATGGKKATGDAKKTEKKATDKKAESDAKKADSKKTGKKAAGDKKGEEKKPKAAAGKKGAAAAKDGKKAGGKKGAKKAGGELTASESKKSLVESEAPVNDEVAPEDGVTHEEVKVDDSHLVANAEEIGNLTNRSQASSRNLSRSSSRHGDELQVGSQEHVDGTLTPSHDNGDLNHSEVDQHIESPNKGSFANSIIENVGKEQEDLDDPKIEIKEAPANKENVEVSDPDYIEQLEKIQNEPRVVPDDIVGTKQKELAQLKVELMRLENAYSHFKKGGGGHQDGILQRMKSPRIGQRSARNLQSPSQNNKTFLGDGPSTLNNTRLGTSHLGGSPVVKSRASGNETEFSLYAMLCNQIGEDNFNKIRYMFDCYTISNTKAKNTVMDLTQYHKFLKDHRICNRSYPQSKADLIFCKNNKYRTLDMLKFVETVVINAEKKFTDLKRLEAVTKLVNGFNMSIFEATSERKQYYQTIANELKHDDVKILFEARIPVLELIFEHHMSQNYEERRTISIYNFLAALTELAIIPELISKLEAMQMFKLWQRDTTSPLAKYSLCFEDFAECIGIIALNGFAQERYADRYPLAVDRVDALFQMMEIASQHTNYGKELELRLRSLQNNRKLGAVYTLNSQPVSQVLWF